MYHTVLKNMKEVKMMEDWAWKNYGIMPFNRYLSNDYRLPVVVDLSNDFKITGHQGPYEDITYDEILKGKSSKYIDYRIILTPDDYPEYFI